MAQWDVDALVRRLFHAGMPYATCLHMEGSCLNVVASFAQLMCLAAVLLLHIEDLDKTFAT